MSNQLTVIEFAAGEALDLDKRDDWLELGRRLGRFNNSMPWWIGDWIRHGERKWGEVYDDAMAVTDVGYVTLRQYAWVAGVFELYTRVYKLDWAHYREVAGIKDVNERMAWLKKAENGGWSVARLRGEIKQAKFLEIRRTRLRDAPGMATVYKGAALDFLATIEPQSMDLLLTDPPYATDLDDVYSFASGWVPAALQTLKPSARAYICTGAYPQELHAYLTLLLGQSEFRMAQVLVWTYRNTMGPSPKYDYKQNWQSVFYLVGPDAMPLDAPILKERFTVFKGEPVDGGDVLDINAPEGHLGRRLHPWQKPDRMAEIIIGQSAPVGARVIDPFAGTGTFLAAAAILGCEAIGCDVDDGALATCEAGGITVKELA